MKFNLAQLNIATALAPMDDPIMANFVNQLDQINALGESSPGFVWRMKDESDNATAIQVFENPLTIVNLTVWESIEALKEFSYRSAHAGVMRRRREWFQPMDEAYLVLWWIPAGHLPTPEEAKAKLALLRSQGATSAAFDFKQPFPAPTQLDAMSEL